MNAIIEKGSLPEQQSADPFPKIVGRGKDHITVSFRRKWLAILLWGWLAPIMTFDLLPLIGVESTSPWLEGVVVSILVSATALMLLPRPMGGYAWRQPGWVNHLHVIFGIVIWLWLPLVIALTVATVKGLTE